MTALPGGNGHGGGGDLIAKGLKEVGRRRADSAGVWLPGNHPQLPVAWVTVNGGAWATNYT